jgi:CysZ protein
MSLLEAISRALRDLMRPRILAVLFLPMLGAIVLWSILLWMFWDPWRGALRVLLDGTAFGAWIAGHAEWFLSGTTALLLIAMVLPAMFVTAVVLTELVAMPQVVTIVAHSYPRVERRGEGSVVRSLSNAARGVLVFVALWIVTLPLWLTGVGALVVPVFNSGYLNQRLFRYDALSEHATPDEYRSIVGRLKWRLYALGVLLAALYYLPFVNLIAPVFSGLAFTHFCLRELERERAGRSA